MFVGAAAPAGEWRGVFFISAEDGFFFFPRSETDFLAANGEADRAGCVCSRRLRGRKDGTVSIEEQGRSRGAREMRPNARGFVDPGHQQTGSAARFAKNFHRTAFTS